MPFLLKLKFPSLIVVFYLPTVSRKSSPWSMADWWITEVTWNDWSVTYWHYPLSNQHHVGAERCESWKRAFTPDEVYAADEAFIISASSLGRPVTGFDGMTTGIGKSGSVTRKLRQFYIEAALNDSIWDGTESSYRDNLNWFLWSLLHDTVDLLG